MTVGETFSWLRRAGPLARIERQTWQRIAVVCLFGAAILFPIGHRNDADIDVDSWPVMTKEQVAAELVTRIAREVGAKS